MLPESIEKRAKLNKYIDQAVQLKREEDTLKEDFKEIKDMVSQEISKDAAKDFTKLVQVRYDKQKAEKNLEKIQTSIANDEILRGGNV